MKMKATIESGETFYKKEDIVAMQAIMARVMDTGFVPRSELIKEFGDTATTRALAILHKTWRALVESREPWNGQEVNGFKKSDIRFSKRQKDKMPPALAWLPQLFEGSMNKYADYKLFAIKCRWLVPVLGGVPKTVTIKVKAKVKAKDETTGEIIEKHEMQEVTEKINCFERDWTGSKVVIQRFGIRAMFKAALPKIGREAYAASRFGFEAIFIEAGRVKNDHVRAITDDQGKGLGTIRSEYIEGGTEFTLNVRIPTSYITPGEVLTLVQTAGSEIGLSPGRSAGYGDFEVLSIEPR